jgi:hypothetical protein
MTGQLCLLSKGWPTDIPSAPSFDRTRQRKLFLSRNNSMDSMITGEVKRLVFNTGFLMISSRMLYLDARSCGMSCVVSPALQEENGRAAVASPLPNAVDMNLRLFVFIWLNLRNVFIAWPVGTGFTILKAA